MKTSKTLKKYAVVNGACGQVHGFRDTKAEANALASMARRKTTADWFIEFGTNVWVIATASKAFAQYRDAPVVPVTAHVRARRHPRDILNNRTL